MFYAIIKLYARFAIRIYCRRIIINKPAFLKSSGPILLACNHPNSFLDGIILTTLFDHPVHSLARGDVFKNKKIDSILRSIKLLPVYRTSEGVENLEHNYTTFNACQQAFEKKESVLIFSEGRCENEWHLRPLKKGTARLATTAWKNDVPLQVIPTALNYSSFKKFGKEIHIYFGDPVLPAAVLSETTEGKQLLAFNHQLNNQLKQIVYEIDPENKAKRKNIFSIKKQTSFYFLLLPAIIGWLLHAPIFYPCKLFCELRFKQSGHYDSALTGLLLLIYPLYLFIAFLIAYSVQPLYGIIAVLLLPFAAWACVQAKYQVDL